MSKIRATERTTQQHSIRGTSFLQSNQSSCISLEDRFPADHFLRKLRVLVEAVLASMNEEFDAVYVGVGLPSVPPERLLKAPVLQALFSVHAEGLLVEAIESNSFYRWLEALSLDEQVWNHSTFSQNQDRLFNEGLARVLFARVKMLAAWNHLTSHEHFSVDGTLIATWASHKGFGHMDDGGDEPFRGGSRTAECSYCGEPRGNDSPRSTTDPDARRSPGSEAKLAHMNLRLMENHNEVIVDVESTESNGRTESEAALMMIRFGAC